MIDTHTHTRFSMDSRQDARQLIAAATELGLRRLIITDHLDYADNHVPDLDLYFRELRSARLQTSMDLVIGIECGYTDEDAQRNAQTLEKWQFEYVINSVHTVRGRDCYFADYFNGRSKEEAYADYYNAVLQSLSAPYHYDAVGHIGYVVRNAPFFDRTPDYGLLGEVLEQILKQIIDRQKILEINSNIRLESPFVPSYEVLKRYKALGGELVTFASDAHSKDRLADGYADVAAAARSLGFKAFATAKNKVITLYDI